MGHHETQGGNQCAKAPTHGLVPKRLAVTGVAPEKLVPAVARKRDGHRLSRQSGHEERGNRRRIGEGLIEHRRNRLESVLNVGPQDQ